MTTADPIDRAEAPADHGSSARRGVVFGVVALALFMASVDLTIVATALHSIRQDLGGGLAWASWIATVYALGQVLAMPLAGKLSDLYGRRRIFLGAVVVFTLASLACGLATSVGMLVVLRAVQSIGGGAFMPSASGIVADKFGANRDRAIGMFSSIFPIGGMVGPIIGGLITAHLSWRYVFFVNVPVGVLLVVVGLFVIPAGRRRPSQRLDVLGIGLLGTLLLSTMLAITSIGEAEGLLRPAFVVPAVFSPLVLVLFVRHARRAAAPFVPPRLLSGRGFGVMNLINFLWGAIVVGLSLLLPLYAQERFGLDPLRAGTLLTARAVGMICVASVSTLALRRTGHRPPMVAGFAVVACGLAGLSFVPGSADPYTWMALAAGVTGVGIGLAVPAVNNASMQLDPANIAAIAGLRGMFRQVGAITSVSLATAFAARTTDPGRSLQLVCVALGVTMLAAIPLVVLVPEHRGSW